MPTLKSKKKLTLKRVAFVFYDTETRQNKLRRGPTDVNVHVPNLCVAQTVCDRCADMNDDDIVNANDNHGNPCGVCKHRENVFDGDDPVRGFVDYITSMDANAFFQFLRTSSDGSSSSFNLLLMKKKKEVDIKRQFEVSRENQKNGRRDSLSCSDRRYGS
ncbi:uncharacterized protein LOC135166260 isoform X1 [Diachasmimorpha longicaudata]|uniref:uncharacterized protein LOC135166260 isoform X1 n=1 Tax=Diachasmimorpha longicaudata TaxID=58733 RepID=UPI0030B90AFE